MASVADSELVPGQYIFLSEKKATTRWRAHEAPAYSFRKSGRRVVKKLTRYDVEEMRRWVRTDGFGLGLREQARALHACYPDVSVRALYDVVINESWFDASYDRTVRLTVDADTPPSWLTCVLTLSPWMLTMLLLIVLRRTPRDA